MLVAEERAEQVVTQRLEVAAEQRGEVMVLTGDEAFLSSIAGALSSADIVHHAETLERATTMLAIRHISCVVIDVGFAGSNIEQLIRNLNRRSDGSINLVVGRQEEDELLIDLVNGGAAYRFLVLPVSPSRIRIAVESCLRQHRHLKTAHMEEAEESSTRQIALDGANEPDKLTADRVVRHTENKAGDAEDVHMQRSCARRSAIRSSDIPLFFGFGLLLLMIAGIAAEMLGWIV